MAQPLISIVVPVLNEAENIPALVSRLTPILDTLEARWEIVFVDDGSTDSTLAAIKALHDQDPRFVAISFSRNFGKEIAIAAGRPCARRDAANILDAGFPHPPQ